MLTKPRTRVTMLILVATEESLNESYPAAPPSVPRARHAVVDFAAARGATAEQLDAIRLAVSEAVSNAILHAYDDGGGQVHVTAGFASDQLWVLVADDGRGFRAPARRPGLGWGLPLIAHMADGLEIADRADGGTEIRMRFGVGEQLP
jgi:serine/threonine-protein kinase RsbW